jgi:hypothetical protein
LREQIDGGAPASEIAASWTDATREFERVREEYLLY